MSEEHTKLARYLAEYLSRGIDNLHEHGHPMDFTKEGLEPIIKQALEHRAALLAKGRGSACNAHNALVKTCARMQNILKLLSAETCPTNQKIIKAACEQADEAMAGRK